MHIRLAKASDTSTLRTLLDEQNRLHTRLLPGFFQEHATKPSRIEAVLNDPNAAILVAEIDSCVAGLVEIRVAQTKDLPILVQKTYAYLQEMIVSECHRGQGIGTQLMAAARTWAQDRGAESLRTSVVPNNAQARAFYAKHGFAEIMVNLESEI